LRWRRQITLASHGGFDHNPRPGLGRARAAFGAGPVVPLERWSMLAVLHALRRLIGPALRDLAPLAAVIALFQIVVPGQPMPGLGRIAAGVVCVALGLALFVRGLEMGLFPLGEAMAGAFTRRGSLLALLVFAFALGFGTTIAEPALIAIAREAAAAAAQAHLIADLDPVKAGYARDLRLTVAASVGFALVVGVLRIVRGWPIHVLIIAGYVAITALTVFAPPEIIGVAYDSGGVTTSTVTVPLVTALGVGLATAIRGRNPIVDGFGLIAFASLTPMAFVIVFGIVRSAP
jgi:uncharacterized membrane protein (DUF2068 family)